MTDKIKAPPLLDHHTTPSTLTYQYSLVETVLLLREVHLISKRWFYLLLQLVAKLLSSLDAVFCCGQDAADLTLFLPAQLDGVALFQQRREVLDQTGGGHFLDVSSQHGNAAAQGLGLHFGQVVLR